MDITASVPDPKPFMPHPNLSDEVNRNIVQSEIEGVCAWTIYPRACGWKWRRSIVGTPS